MGAERVLVGEIGRPHGVRGLVKLRSFTADPSAIDSYGLLTDEAGAQRIARQRFGVQSDQVGEIELILLRRR